MEGMKRDSNNGRSERSDFLLRPPIVAFMSLGMVLPEYLLVVVVCAFSAMTVLAIVHTINGRDDQCHAKPSPAPL